MVNTKVYNTVRRLAENSPKALVVDLAPLSQSMALLHKLKNERSLLGMLRFNNFDIVMKRCLQEEKDFILPYKNWSHNDLDKELDHWQAKIISLSNSL